MIVVKVQYSNGKTEEFPLGDGTHKIGRAQDNGLVLQDKIVSRHHAELVVQGEQGIIRDTKSSSGIYVNDVHVTETQVKPGDRIHIGQCVLLLTKADDDKKSEGSKSHTTGEKHPQEEEKVPQEKIGRLELLSPQGSPTPVLLDKKQMTLGRVPECHIHIPDKQVSREHAKICFVQEGYVLENLRDNNKTYVNDKEITKHPLVDGDIIRIGLFQYRFTTTSPSAPTPPGPHPRKRWPLLSIFILIILVVCGCLGYYFAKKEGVVSSIINKIWGTDTNVPTTAINVPYISVSVTRLQKRTFTSILEESGDIAPEQKIPVIPKVNVPIKKILVKEGEKITKDQMLFTLEDKFLKKELENTEALLEKLRRVLDETSKAEPLVGKKVSLTETGVSVAKINLKLGKGTEKEVLEAEQKRLEALKEHSDIKSRLRAIRDEEMKNVSFKIDTLKDQIRETVIRAPINGTVVQLTAIEDSLPQGPLLLILSKEIFASFNVSQIDIQKVWPGQKAFVVSPAYPDNVFSGMVTEIGQAFRIVDRTTAVKVQLENAGDKLRPGNSVTVKLLLGEHKDVPAVSKDAVFSGSYIYIVKEDPKSDKGKKLGKAYKIDVKTGYYDKNFYELDSSILQKLDWQTWIVIEGLFNLHDQDPVEIVTQK